MQHGDQTPRVAACVAGAALVVLGVGAVSVPIGHTYAAWSDVVVVPAEVGAGLWLGPGDPPLPPQCADVAFDSILIGTRGNDVLIGTAGNDLVFGLSGKDQFYGLAGDDCLVGGNGKDLLMAGGHGDDVLLGLNGKDTLYGGPGDDRLHGGNGRSSLFGGSGTDQLSSSHPQSVQQQDGPEGPEPPARAGDTARLAPQELAQTDDAPAGRTSYEPAAGPPEQPDAQPLEPPPGDPTPSPEQPAPGPDAPDQAVVGSRGTTDASRSSRDAPAEDLHVARRCRARTARPARRTGARGRGAHRRPRRSVR
jgi:Ca2+-binding RTX toxin-like protein